MPRRLQGRGKLFILLGILTLVTGALVSQRTEKSTAAPTSQRAEEAAERVTPALTRQLAARGLKFGDPVFIRIFKEPRDLELWVKEPKKKSYALFRTYRIAAMSGKLGPKEQRGDLQAPEGFYYVSRKGMNPNSRFHLSFNIGYPNEFDQAHGRDGAFIMVHGNRVSIGCYAMTDRMVEEIYTLTDAALKNGQKFFRVHSFPFRMTEKRMKEARLNQWHRFWINLKEGYDAFEKSKIPPNVTVKDKRYVVEPR